MLELTIFHKNKIYFPLTEGDIVMTNYISGASTMLSFKVVKDDNINFLEGDIVTFVADGVKMFKGFIFSKKRTKENIISVVCFDQLRYLLNKDTKVYENLTATKFIKNISNEFLLKSGEFEDTKFVIEKRVEDNRKLLDMINTALTITSNMTNEKYVFYDDFMELKLKNINNMKTDYLLDDETAVNYIYESSINENTYNQIKVIDDITKKIRQTVIAKDDASIKKYGVLQKLYYLKNELNPKEFAEKRLEEFNEVTRKLTVFGAVGRLDLRAGNSIIVDLNLGDVLYSDRFLITYIKHKFNADYHDMDLTLVKDKSLK